MTGWNLLLGDMLTVGSGRSAFDCPWSALGFGLATTVLTNSRSDGLWSIVVAGDLGRGFDVVAFVDGAFKGVLTGGFRAGESFALFLPSIFSSRTSGNSLGFACLGRRSTVVFLLTFGAGLRGVGMVSSSLEGTSNMSPPRTGEVDDDVLDIGLW